MLGKQFNIQEARIIGDSEYNLQLVENMKETLFSVYGNEARDFFGEIRTENYSIVEPDSPRYLSLPTSNDNIICYEKTTLTEHWGVWWNYFTLEAILYYKNVEYDTFDKKLPTDRAVYIYSDSETNNLTGSYDWRYLDDPANMPNSVATGDVWMGDKDFFTSIEWDVALANRGVVNIEGNHKYGFFPKVKNVYCEITYYDTLLKNGGVTTISRSK